MFQEWRGREPKIPLSHESHVKYAHACFTWCGLADGRVVGAEFKAVHAETVVAAVTVDAALRAGVGGGTLVYVHTRLPVTLQLEAGVTAALRGEGAQRRIVPQTVGSGTFPV